MDEKYSSGMEEYAREHQGFFVKPGIPETPSAGRWLKIYWIGLGSKTSGLHTKEEFLHLMSKQYPEHIYRRFKGDKEIPSGLIRKKDLEGWMKFTGAIWV